MKEKTRKALASYRRKFSDVVAQGGRPKNLMHMVPVRKYTVKAHFRVHPKGYYKQAELRELVTKLIIAFLSQNPGRPQRRTG